MGRLKSHRYMYMTVVCVCVCVRVCVCLWRESMLQIINKRVKNNHLRNKSSAKTCCTGRINTVIHVSAQSTTNNNVKGITNSLKEVQAYVMLLNWNIFKKMVDNESRSNHNISWFILWQSSSALSNNSPKWIFIFTTWKTTNSIAATKEKDI